MANIYTKRGVYYAQYKIDGVRHTEALGVCRNERHARKLANQKEARAHFVSCSELLAWQASQGYSAAFIHDGFIGRAHVPLETFVRWLKEADIKTKPKNQCLDHVPKPQKNATRYRVGAKRLTFRELLAEASVEITPAGLRHRLTNGWDAMKAITTPAASYAEAGRKGAQNRWRK